MLHINGDILLIGDLHGNADALMELAYKWESAGNKPCSLIILGDVGLGFRTCTDILIDTFSLLIAEGWSIYLVRGNHDNPVFWTDDYADKLGGAIALKDNKIISINGKNTYIAGGGISIDRSVRAVDRSYWADEALYVPPTDSLPTCAIHCILSHVGPTPPTMSKRSLDYWRGEDRSLDADLELEKVAIARLLTLNAKFWVYGHYHFSSKFLQDNTECCILDEHECYDANRIFPVASS